VTVPQGLSTLSNPFNYESNLVSQVLTNVPEGTQLYRFNAAAQRWQVNPRLDATLISEASQNLVLSGIGSVQIEVSYDLSHWSNFAAATNGSGSWELLVTNASEFPQRFFRPRPAP